VATHSNQKVIKGYYSRDLRNWVFSSKIWIAVIQDTSNIQFSTNSLTVNFRDVFIINDPNGEFLDGGLENLLCNAEADFYKNDQFTCNLCTAKWDLKNFYCGDVENYWIGSDQTGYCINCDFQILIDSDLSCYCECNDEYDIVPDGNGNSHCVDLAALSCPVCSVSGSRNGYKLLHV
jgi:hypothetical protein